MSDEPNPKEYGNFTMNYHPAARLWRGKIEVPIRKSDGTVQEWVTTRYEGRGPYTARGTETEYISLTIVADDPMRAARESRLPINKATNQPANYRATAVNRGTLFLPTADRLQKAAEEGRNIPAAQGYVLLPIQGKPTYVEVGSWPRERTRRSFSNAAKDLANVDETPPDAPSGRIDFYSGPAEIHDPEVALARRLAANKAHESAELSAMADITPKNFVEPNEHEIDESRMIDVTPAKEAGAGQNRIDEAPDGKSARERAKNRRGQNPEPPTEPA